jgi:hypothetical protein
VSTDGRLVVGTAVFDDLEIDVPILNLINLAGIGNHYLNQLRT